MSKISVTTIAGLTSGGDANTVKIESGDDFVVDTNVLKVDSSNNRVGIGTASPTQIVDIAHSGSQSAGAVRIGDPSAISSNTGIYMRTTGLATIGAAGGKIVFDTNFGSGEKVRIDSDGMKFNGDTAAANALDDYEEGTFTPSFTNGVNGGATYTAQNGRYTKIGRQVITEVDLDLNSFVANGSHVYVGGFPFVSNSAAPYGGGFFNYNGGFYNSIGQWLMIANAQYAAFYRQTDGAALGGTSSGMSMGGNCRFVLLYMTA